MGGSKRRMYYNVDDDVNVDDDYDDNGDDDDDVDDDDGDDDDDDDVVRACAIEIHMNISQEPFCVEIYRNSAVRQSRDTRFVRTCAVKCHFVWKFTGEMAEDTSAASVLCRGHLRGQRFVRACAVETHMDISQEQVCNKIYRENGRGHLRGQRFVRACAVEMHMDISQEPFGMEICRENAKRDGYHLDWTPGINCYRKNPSVWPDSLGKSLLWAFFEAEISFSYNICRVLELKYAICMVFKAFWHWITCLHSARSMLQPAGKYLQHFVVFATYCLELVLRFISGWFRVYLGIISGWF